VHEFDVIPWLAESRVVNVEVRYPKTSSLAHSGLKEPIIVFMELENGVLVDVEMNVNVQFGYQVTTEAVFEQGLARIGQPAGIQRWSAGQFSVKDHEDFTTRFATAYDRQIQSWVNAVHDGTLVAGPNAWDGYLVALSCEAGVKALEEGGIIPVEAEPRPDFYAYRFLEISCGSFQHQPSIRRAPMVRIAFVPTPLHHDHDLLDFPDVTARLGYKYMQITP